MKKLSVIILIVTLIALAVSLGLLYRMYSNTHNSLVASNNKLSHANAKIVQITQENNYLKNQNLLAEEKIKEFNAVQDELNILKKQLEDKDNEISATKEDVCTIEKELQETDEIRKTIMSELSICDEKIAALENEIQSLSSLLAVSEKNLEMCKDEFQELQSGVSKLEGEIALSDERKEQLKTTYETLIVDLKDQIKSQKITIHSLRGKISVNILDGILFDFGKASVMPEGEKVLQKIGKRLKTLKTKQIRIIGHADSIHIKPEYRYKYPTNWELSAARSAAVVRYFQKNFGIDPKQMEVAAHSYYDPVATNETSAGRALNRRVNIVIVPELY